MKQWYESNTGNHQGLIIDEETGDNIAVIYDKKHTEFICRACNNYDNFMELLETANILLADALDRNECHDEETGIIFDDWGELVAAIDKCERR